MKRRGRFRGLFVVSRDAGERPNDLLDRDVEASDDAGVATSREQLGIGIAGRHPRISVFRVGDDVGEAPGTDREDLSRFCGRVAERVSPARPSGQKTKSPGASASSPSWFRKRGRPLRTKNISSAPKCICSRGSGASGASSYNVAPILASSGRQKIRCRVRPSSSSPSQASENRFWRVIRLPPSRSGCAQHPRPRRSSLGPASITRGGRRVGPLSRRRIHGRIVTRRLGCERPLRIFRPCARRSTGSRTLRSSLLRGLSGL